MTCGTVVYPTKRSRPNWNLTKRIPFWLTRGDLRVGRRTNLRIRFHGPTLDEVRLGLRAREALRNRLPQRRGVFRVQRVCVCVWVNMGIRIDSWEVYTYRTLSGEETGGGRFGFGLSES